MVLLTPCGPRYVREAHLRSIMRTACLTTWSNHWGVCIMDAINSYFGTVSTVYTTCGPRLAGPFLQVFICFSYVFIRPTLFANNIGAPRVAHDGGFGSWNLHQEVEQMRRELPQASWIFGPHGPIQVTSEMKGDGRSSMFHPKMVIKQCHKSSTNIHRNWHQKSKTCSLKHLFYRRCDATCCMPRPPAAMPALMLMTLDDVKQLSLNTSKAFSHCPDSSQALIHQLHFHMLPWSQSDGGFIA